MRVGSSRALLGAIAVVLVLVVGGTALFASLNWTGPRSSIQVARVWSDSVDAASGMTYYLLDVNVSNGQSAAWQVDPSHFSLASNASRVYSPVENYSVVALLDASTIPAGGRVAGELAFLLPKAESPARLSYSDQAGRALQTAAIPTVSGVASRFDPSVHVQFNGTAAANAVASWDGITNQTNALAFFGGEPGYRNYSFVAFTGQKIYVTLTLYYYKFPYDPNSIVVESVTSDDGYAVSDVVAWQAGFFSTPQPHQLPVTMTGYASNVDVTLLVTVPPGPQPGVLHFTIQFGT